MTTETDAMSRVDGCPEACGNTEPPRSVIELPEAVRCAYACSDCGHVWMTDWKKD